MLFKENETLTYYEVLERASSFLKEIRHSSFVAEWLMRERLDWTKTDLILNYNNEMPGESLRQFEQDFKAFLKGQPMQYIIGHEWFYNRKFKVTENTLIPRPETEEWLDRVLKELPDRKLNVLDIGTGTGVMGITLKLERPNDTVTATDISEAALKVAKENAKRLQANVSFKLGDLFDPVKEETFDLIVCNPPYIAEAEMDVMDSSVLAYEPKAALFAKEEGLANYKKIAESINEYLKPESCAFFEIGYKQGEKVSQLFKNALPEARIELWKDFNGHDRVVAVYLETESVK